MMDRRDIALQTLTPSVIVPKFSVFQKLEQAGSRFCIASDGLWLEVKRSWLDLCVPLALQYKVNMPYGQLKQSMQFNFGKLPSGFLKQFIEDAREALPYEHAAWFIWSEEIGAMRYQTLEAESASVGAITYRCPVLEDGEEVIADIHSHGHLNAFFSRQDDDDDKSEVKIAIVVGNVGTDNPTMKMRLCANGYFLPLPCQNDAVEGDEIEA